MRNPIFLTALGIAFALASNPRAGLVQDELLQGTNKDRVGQGDAGAGSSAGSADSLTTCDLPQFNVLFAVADDWSVHAGAYGTKWVKTPGFDRIARGGILFANAFTPSAKCAPSRASILTGRYPWQLEEAGNHMSIFPPKFRTWLEVLGNFGWHVGVTNKGWGPGSALNEQGELRELTGAPYNNKRTEPPSSRFSKNDYAANFSEFLDEVPKGTPWCFWFGASEPHRDYEFQSGASEGGLQPSDIDQIPAYWPDSENVRHDILDYAFAVQYFDAHLVRMIQELEQRGQLDRTLIIVTSDHGMPFPRIKGQAYYQSNHIPLAVRWPQGMESLGRVVDDHVSVVDISATILDFAGIDESASGMQAIAGHSWRRIIESTREGQVEPWRDYALVGKERTDVGRPFDWGYPIRGILRDGHLLLQNLRSDRWPSGNPETGYLDTDGSPTKTEILELGRINRSDPYWQLNFGMRPHVELYDIMADSDCMVNLADSEAHAELRERLLAELQIRLHEQKDPRVFGKGDCFDRYPVHLPHLRNFYERFLSGEVDHSAVPWVNPSDFESNPVSPFTGVDQLPAQ